MLRNLGKNEIVYHIKQTAREGCRRTRYLCFLT